MTDSAGQRFGSPQLIGLLLLLALAGQCLWYAAKTPLVDSEHVALIGPPNSVHSGESPRSPAAGLIASVARRLTSNNVPHAWMLRIPFIGIGLLLGASLWYVARRLFGNAGGYIALTLYAFCPQIIMRCSNINPFAPEAWGVFGTIFTAIAVGHTLYAPREVVLWNWRRILLLGVSIALVGSSALAMIFVVPIALLLMLWIVPQRRGAAIVIMLAATALGAALWLAVCALEPGGLSTNLHASMRTGVGFSLFRYAAAYEMIGRFFLQMPALLALLLIALVTYTAWPRTRFFGTTAPLIVFVLLLAGGIALPYGGGFNSFVVAIPFGCVFIAGVFADLLESKHATLTFALVAGALLGHAATSVAGLLQLQ